MSELREQLGQEGWGSSDPPVRGEEAVQGHRQASQLAFGSIKVC